ncbi:MAG: hypothetical protein ACLFM0_01755, partial [Spirochaetales bacterium]
SVYHPATGGCFDGIGVHRLNRNMGAESTLSFLLASVQMQAMEQRIAAYESATEPIRTEPSNGAMPQSESEL